VFFGRPIPTTISLICNACNSAPSWAWIEAAVICPNTTAPRRRFGQILPNFNHQPNQICAGEFQQNSVELNCVEFAISLTPDLFRITTRWEIPAFIAIGAGKNFARLSRRDW
jgi:hypothetical protein